MDIIFFYSCDRLGEYKGEDIMITLPGDMKFTDYDYFTVYCIRFSHNFGYVRIPQEAQTYQFNSTAALPIAPASTPTPLVDCDQEPEARGENCGRNCETRRRRRKKGSKY